MKIPETVRASPLSWGRGPGCTAIELSPAAGPHWQALNLNPNRNLARLRFLEIKSKITIKIGKKPFRLNSMAVGVRESGNPMIDSSVLTAPLPARPSRGEGEQPCNGGNVNGRRP